jgi:hypothetical protein
MRFQLLAARAAFGALVLAVLVGAGAVIAVRLGGAPIKTGETLMIPATALGLLALAAAALWLRSAIAHNRGDGKRIGMIALVGSLAFLYPPLNYVYTGFTSLPIHDITSDPEDPPSFVALAKIHPANDRAFDGQRKIHYKGEDVPTAYAIHDKYLALTKPHAGLLLSPRKVYWRSFETAKRLGWTIMDSSEKDLRIEATDRSLWFGRIFDIVIRVRPAGTSGGRVDARSQSREDAIDHGANAARLKAFFGRVHVQ